MRGENIPTMTANGFYTVCFRETVKTIGEVIRRVRFDCFEDAEIFAEEKDGTIA